ncbi:MAG: phage tail fiber protein [Rhodospirillales bacterium]|nr:phage tail fiber protein [Rhodospirillales bacterium]
MTDHITIGDVAPRIQYAADGAQTDFTYPFPVFADADMEAYIDDALKILTADYTVSGAGSSEGGVVTFASAPAAGVTVTLRRRLAIRRTTDFQEGGAFRAKVINDELDYQTAAIQQVADELSRVVRLDPTDADAALTLPRKADRASAFLAFDANGDPVAAVDAGGYPASPFAATLLDDADAPAMHATLGLGAAAVLDPGTGAGDAVQLDGDGKLPAVDGSQLVNLPIPAGSPAGSVIMFAGSTPPAGWLACDGAVVSRDTYADLFAAIGTAWGTGDGSTTFNLPDLRGRAPIGVGQGSGLSNRSLAATGGAETHQLSVAEMPSHAHAGTLRSSQASQTGTDGLWGVTSGTSTGSAGGNGAHNNMQPFAAINFIIKA